MDYLNLYANIYMYACMCESQYAVGCRMKSSSMICFWSCRKWPLNHNIKWNDCISSVCFISNIFSLIIIIFSVYLCSEIQFFEAKSPIFPAIILIREQYFMCILFLTLKRLRFFFWKFANVQIFDNVLFFQLVPVNKTKLMKNKDKVAIIVFRCDSCIGAEMSRIT